MIIKLFDGQEIYCSKKEAAGVVEAISRKVDMISIRDMFIKASAIAKIVPGGIGEADQQYKLPPPVKNPIHGSLKKKLKAKNPKLFNKIYG